MHFPLYVNWKRFHGLVLGTIMCRKGSCHQKELQYLTGAGVNEPNPSTDGGLVAFENTTDVQLAEVSLK